MAARKSVPAGPARISWWFGRRKIRRAKFHIYSATWVPGQYVKYAIDGKTTAQFGAAYASNQAVTAIFTNILTGDNTKDDITGEGPRNMEVAWVRVWRKK